MFLKIENGTKNYVCALTEYFETGGKIFVKWEKVAHATQYKISKNIV